MATCKKRKESTWQPRVAVDLVVRMNVRIILDGMDLTPQEYATLYADMVASRERKEF